MGAPACNYQKYQIVEVPPTIAKIGQCDYPRPFLIYNVAGTVMWAMLISTQIETFYNGSRDFKMLKTDDGFGTTGLVEDSFVKNQDFTIDTNLRLRIIGHLSGDLLARFRQFEKRHNL
ncbi:MAG: hypothetical protein ABSE73_00665 [Planctomycetota bacterium]